MQPSKKIQNKDTLDVGEVEKDLTVEPKPWAKVNRWDVFRLILTLAEFILQWDKPLENSKTLKMNGQKFKWGNLKKKDKVNPMSPIMQALILLFALTLLRMSAVSLLVFGRMIGFDGISRHTHAIKMLQHLLVLRNFATFSSKRMLLLVLTQELIMIFLEMNVLVLLSKMI